MKQIFKASWRIALLFSTVLIVSCEKEEENNNNTDQPEQVRFQDEIFSNVARTTVTFTGNNDLSMDVYEPIGDTSSMRPLIVFAHGGAFIDGSRDLPDMIHLCETFARKGYVTASFSYRLGSGITLINDSAALLDVVVRAIHDGKAAVRYFRKDVVENGNTYKIDTNVIIGAGNSAGAILMAHVAYLNDPAILPNHILDALQNEGGLEGNRGNAGYSSAVDAVVNLAGALDQIDFIKAGDVPLVSAHGDADPVVPFGCGPIYANFPPFTNRIQLCGSESMHAQALAVGVRSELLVFPGASHCPWIGAGGAPSPEMDEVEDFVSEFLYQEFFQ